jgi:acyl-CoA synthetase (AMP-forming)/AMP-acid ligase II
MYPGLQTKLRPQQPAFVMAQSGETITYAELDRRSNRLAHFLRAKGLGRLDHYAIFMENNVRYVECCAAGERAGLYYTCVNSYLTAGEAAYILDNNVSSLETAIHGAPCPVPVKEQMIAWWGPIVDEYHAATEAHCMVFCDSAEWLAHRGTVGRVLAGELHVLDEDMRPVPAGTPGTLWFRTASPFEYFNDPVKTREARSPDGTMSTVGDVGYVDIDGYVYLTDRRTFIIISGGVNIYPQECENLLITHPLVADAAVFGVPNGDLGEEVRAVVQPMPGIRPDVDFAEELIAFCRQHLAHIKCARSMGPRVWVQRPRAVSPHTASGWHSSI